MIVRRTETLESAVLASNRFSSDLVAASVMNSEPIQKPQLNRVLASLVTTAGLLWLRIHGTDSGMDNLPKV
jgi:hypothetical protein